MKIKSDFRTSEPVIRLESDRELFEAVREMLAQGRKVKLTVSGNSMRPLIADNRDQVLLVKAASGELKRGDIILYESGSGKYILHRVLRRAGDMLITVGDACRYPDGPVGAGDVLAKAVRIYRKGREIDCGRILWRATSAAWLAALPFREQLMSLFAHVSHGKAKLNRWVGL